MLTPRARVLGALLVLSLSAPAIAAVVPARASLALTTAERTRA